MLQLFCWYTDCFHKKVQQLSPSPQSSKPMLTNYTSNNKLKMPYKDYMTTPKALSDSELLNFISNNEINVILT